MRSGGHLVVISHAQPPSESSPRGPNMITAREDAAELALPSEEWSIEAAEERTRPAIGHDGAPSKLLDAVLVMQRR